MRTPNVAAATNLPGAREQAVTWMDGSGNAYLLGGLGFDANGTLGTLDPGGARASVGVGRPVGRLLALRGRTEL